MSDTSTTTKKAVVSGTDIRFLTITALFIALTYVFTAFINIRLPISINGGLIHLGNVPLFLCAIIFGKKSGAIAGGVGMGLFDLLSGWTAWAPFTLIIVALCSGCHYRKASRLRPQPSCYVSSCYHQGSGLLYCRRHYLQQLDCSSHLHPGQSHSGRCSCHHRAHHRRAIKKGRKTLCIRL